MTPPKQPCSPSGLTGLEILHRISSGLIPAPPAAELVGFAPTYVMPGRVVFAYEPREEHYNTLGAVHGGILTTVLDTVMGCAVHSKLDAGIAPVTIELKTSFVHPVTLASGILRAEGTVVHPGSRVATAEAQARGRGRNPLRARIVDLADLTTSRRRRRRSSSRPKLPIAAPYNAAMEPRYSPEGVEERWQETWEEEGLYGADADDPRPTFVIASRRRTSRASCTWATRSSSRSPTRSSAGGGCRASTASSSRATTTPASRRRASSRRSWTRRGRAATTSAARRSRQRVWEWLRALRAARS